VRAFVLQTGGVQRHPPRRPTRCLGMAEREEISRGVAAGESCRQIAARLERAPSTVSRELARNGGRHRYRAQAADAAAFGRAQRPKPAKLVLQPRLRAVVEAKLALRWSPQQIAGWLLLAYPSDPVMRVSHETIYLSLFVQSRGALRRELQRCLRTGRAMRYPQGKRLPQGRGQLRDVVLISERPAEAEDRAVLATGKATCCWASVHRRWRRWWSGPAATSPWSRCPTGTRLSRSAPPSLLLLLGCPSSSGGR
jgi:IS30 family transposase